jgi:hypothetical protein
MIPAPEAATGKTRYICDDCSARRFLKDSGADGNFEMPHFDRYQFDCHGVRLTPRLITALVASECDRIISRHSPTLDAARRRGALWIVGAIRERLCALPDKQRTCLLLHAWGGLSYDEIAKALAISTAAVHKNIIRAKNNLSVAVTNVPLDVPVPTPLLKGTLSAKGGGNGKPATRQKRRKPTGQHDPRPAVCAA